MQTFFVSVALRYMNRHGISPTRCGSTHRTRPRLRGCCRTPPPTGSCSTRTGWGLWRPWPRPLSSARPMRQRPVPPLRTCRRRCQGTFPSRPVLQPNSWRCIAGTYSQTSGVHMPAVYPWNTNNFIFSPIHYCILIFLLLPSV